MRNSRLAYLLAISLVPFPLAAQGFDCDKAQKPVEKLICITPEVGALDKDLNAAVQARLAAAQQDRAEFLADSRRWLVIRDRNCPVPARPMTTKRRSATVACLAQAYRARLAAIASSPSTHKPAGDVDKTLCHRFVDIYRRTLAERTNDPKISYAALNQSPFAFLANTPGSGITRAPQVPALPETNARALDDWGRGQTPPVRFSPKVRQAILDLGSSALLTIDHAPATNFYVASQVQGTAHCIYARTFRIKNGVAERVVKPLWSDQPGDTCGVDQFFGVIDGRTVAVQDNESPYEPSLAARLTIKSWDQDAFGSACSIAFDYDPAFVEMTDEPAQEPERRCDSAACIALKPAAQALVEAVQRDPLAVRRDAIERLSLAQSKAFAAMEKLARDKRGEVPAPEAPANPASYLDQNPLLLPLQHKGDVYLASIGHYTIGWRIYPDWSVKLEKLDHDQLTSIGTASIAMRRGALRATTVE